MRYIVSSFDFLNVAPRTASSKLFDIPRDVIPPDAEPWTDDSEDLAVLGADLKRDLAADVKAKIAAMKARQEKLKEDLMGTRKAFDEAGTKLAAEDRAALDKQHEVQHALISKINLLIGDTVYVGLYEEPPAPPKHQSKPPAKDEKEAPAAPVPPAPPVPVRWIQVTFQG